MNKSFKTSFRRKLFIVGILSLFMKIIQIPFLLLIAIILSEVIFYATKGDVNKVCYYSIILFLIVILQHVINVFLEISYQKQTAIQLQKCKIELYEKFLSNPLYVLYGTNHGDNIEKLDNDFNKFTERFLSLYPNLVASCISAVVFFVFIFIRSWEMGLIIFCISIFQFIPPMLVKKYMKVNYENCRNVEAELTDMVVEGYDGTATIKLYDLKEWWLTRISNIYCNYLKVGSKAIYTFRAEEAMFTFVDSILKYGTYIIVGIFVLIKMLSIEHAVQIIAISGSFFGATKSGFDLIPSFSESNVAGERLSNWLNEYELVDIREEETDSIIQLSDVTFSYNDTKILSNCDVSFNMNSTFKLRGRNGLGKSTIFRLMVGLLPSDSGSIEVGGRNPLNNYELNSENYIFYLPQEDYNISITPKVLFELLSDDKEDVAYALAERFNLSREQIENSLVSTLSGGERKKVFLALAFASSPKFLFLDEPTNSLDIDSRKVLVNLIKERQEGLFIIAHTDELDETVNYSITLSDGGLLYE